MPRPTIENIRQLGDFVPLFRWNVSFATFPSAVTGAPTSDALNLRCESSELPKATTTMMDVNIRGHKVKQPAITNYSESITLGFIETVDMVVMKFIKAWRDAIWANQTGVAAGPKSALQATILLRQLNNQDVEIWEYKLVGATMSDHNIDTLESNSTEAFKPKMVLSYDYYVDQAL